MKRPPIMLTADRLKMGTWTRKARLKFRNRWRRQHNGHNFCWYSSEYVFAIKPPHGEIEVILHVRDTSDVVSCISSNA